MNNMCHLIELVKCRVVVGHRVVVDNAEVNVVEDWLCRICLI